VDRALVASPDLVVGPSPPYSPPSTSAGASALEESSPKKLIVPSRRSNQSEYGSAIQERIGAAKKPLREITKRSEMKTANVDSNSTERRARSFGKMSTNANSAA
jgi:hypothetical protein